MDKPALGEWVGRIASRIRATKSVVTPLQWALGIILPVALAALVLGPPEFKLWFLFVFLFIIFYFIAIYTYWTFKDPDRLQTEEHREHMTQLTGYRDSTGVVLDNAPNTTPPQLGGGSPPGIQP